MDIVKTGSIWVLRTAPILDVNGARLTGLTDIKCSVSRLTSGVWQWLDTADATFRAVPAGYQYTMTAVDATKAAGVYAYALDFASVTNAALGDQIFIDIQQTSLTNAINANQAGGGVYGYVVDKVEANLTVATSTLATAADLATAQGNITTILGYGAPPSASAISTQVNADITSAHGSGSYLTASTAGLATATDVTNATTAINAHTDSAVAPLALEATLTAIEGAGWTASDNLHTIASYGAPPSAATVSAAVNADITTAHGAGSYLTASTAGLATAGDVSASTTAVNLHTDAAVAPLATGAALASVAADTAQTVDALYNAKRLNGAGLLIQYADDGVTPAYQATVTDVSGNPITLSPGEPARTTALVPVP